MKVDKQGRYCFGPLIQTVDCLYQHSIRGGIPPLPHLHGVMLSEA